MQATTPRVLEIDTIIMYSLKLHDPRYLDKYVSFPRGVFTTDPWGGGRDL